MVVIRLCLRVPQSGYATVYSKTRFHPAPTLQGSMPNVSFPKPSDYQDALWPLKSLKALGVPKPVFETLNTEIPDALNPKPHVGLSVFGRFHI